MTEPTREQRDNLLEALVEICRNPHGRKLFHQTVHSGYSFSLDTPGKSSICLDKEHRIAMDRNLSYDEMIFGLIHEMRHSRQYINGGSDFYNFRKNDIKSQTICSRMMEADAQAFTMMICSDMAERGFAGPLEAFKKTFGYIADAYEKAPDNKMKAAFDAWYDNNDMKAAYEGSNHVNQLSFKPADEFTFERSLDTKQMADAICSYNGKNYLGDDVSYLETGKFIDLSENTHGFLNDKMYYRMQDGLAVDTSYKSMPSRTEPPKDNPLRDFLMDMIKKEQKGR